MQIPVALGEDLSGSALTVFDPACFGL